MKKKKWLSHISYSFANYIYIFADSINIFFQHRPVSQFTVHCTLYTVHCTLYIVQMYQLVEEQMHLVGFFHYTVLSVIYAICSNLYKCIYNNTLAGSIIFVIWDTYVRYKFQVSWPCRATYFTINLLYDKGIPSHTTTSSTSMNLTIWYSST